MNDKGYEYRLARNDNRKIMVAYSEPDDREPSHWWLYMECDYEEQAWRVLNLLQHPTTEGRTQVRK